MRKGEVEPKRQRLLGQLVTNVSQRFQNHLTLEAESATPYGIPQPYELNHAIDESMRELGRSSIDIAATLMKQTRVSPDEFKNYINSDLAGQIVIVPAEKRTGHEEGRILESWENFCRGLSHFILEREIGQRHPEIKEEELRRKQEYNRSVNRKRTEAVHGEGFYSNVEDDEYNWHYWFYKVASEEGFSVSLVPGAKTSTGQNLRVHIKVITESDEIANKLSKLYGLFRSDYSIDMLDDVSNGYIPHLLSLVKGRKDNRILPPMLVVKPLAKEFLQRCFMASYEEKSRILAKATVEMRGYLDHPTDEENKMYASLQEIGVEPLGPTDIKEIVRGVLNENFESHPELKP